MTIYVIISCLIGIMGATSDILGGPEMLHDVGAVTVGVLSAITLFVVSSPSTRIFKEHAFLWDTCKVLALVLFFILAYAQWYILTIAWAVAWFALMTKKSITAHGTPRR